MKIKDVIVCAALTFMFGQGLAQEWQVCYQNPSPIELTETIEGITGPVAHPYSQEWTDRFMTATVKYWIDIQKIPPTCPGFDDGHIIIHDVRLEPTDAGWVYFDDIPISDLTVSVARDTNPHQTLEAIPPGDDDWIDIEGPSGRYKITLTTDRSQFAKTEFKVSFSMAFELNLQAPVEPEWKYEVQPASSPFIADGQAYIVHPLASPWKFQVHWDDGITARDRIDLAVGTHPYTYQFNTGLGDSCCTRSEIEVVSDYAGVMLDEHNFNDGNIDLENETNTYGCEPLEGGVYFALEDGAYWGAYIPSLGGTPTVLQDYLQIKFDWAGPDGNILIDFGDNQVLLPFNAVQNKVEIFYPTNGLHLYEIGVLGQQGCLLDNFQVFNGHVAKLTLQNQRSVDQDYVFKGCIGDELYLLSNIQVRGGLAPIMYSWDTDEDGYYDDESGIDYVHLLDRPETQNISLKVTDVLGQEAFIDFTVVTGAQEQITMSFPDLDILDVNIKTVSICDQTGPFDIMSNPSSYVLVNGDTIEEGYQFVASTLGVGTHTISAHGDHCSTPAVVTIKVHSISGLVDQNQISWFKCQDTFDLNGLLTGPAEGFFMLDDSIMFFSPYITSDMPITNGEHVLHFVSGAGDCSLVDSIQMTIRNSPISDLEDLTIVINSAFEPFPLDTFFTDSTSRNGLWSGGNYVSPDGIFDPALLQPGEYEVTYTVGNQNCSTSSTATITIESLTSVKNITESQFDLYPNPSDGQFTIALYSGNNNNTTLRIYDMKGVIVYRRMLKDKGSSSVDTNLPKGLYYVVVSGYTIQETRPLIIQ